MTHDQLGALFVVAVILIGVVSDRLKRRKPPGVVFIDVVEVWERVPKKRMPSGLVNMAIVAGIVLLIWIMNR